MACLTQAKMLISRSLRRLQNNALKPRAFHDLALGPPKANTVEYNGREYPYRWLRDSCQCPQCVHPTNRQKLHRTSDIPKNVKPAEDGVRRDADGVHITWGPGHRSFYPSAFLQRCSSREELSRFHRDVGPALWLQEDIKSSPNLFLKYDDINTERGLLNGLTQLTRYGLLFVTGVPNEETSNASCEARTLAKKFSEIRETFYGDLWDVVNLANSRNIAYTNLHLGLHMDLLCVLWTPR